jgi:integrase
MAAIYFRLRSKANKKVSVKIRLIQGRGNDLELNTGFTINPNDWKVEDRETDKKNPLTAGKPKQNSEANKRLFNNLKKLESFIFDKLNEDSAKEVVIDTNWLKSKIDECFDRVEKTDDNIVVNFLQSIIDNADIKIVKGSGKMGLSKSRVNSYINSKNILIEYQNKLKRQILFSEINKKFVDDFVTWLLKTKKFSKNHAGKQINNLKTVCREAQKNEIKVNPYTAQIEGFGEHDDDRHIVTFTPSELEKIRTVDLSIPALLQQGYNRSIKETSQALINARNWMLFGCEIGQRGGDLLELTKENIRYKNGNIYVDLKQEKTGKDITVGINDLHVIRIIENEFPYKISTQKLNEHIKDVCRLAGINEMTEGKIFDRVSKRKVLGMYPKFSLVTTHSFRRSFATNYYKKIPTAILINITGHSKESLFLKYINKPADKDTNADLFRQFYEQMKVNESPQLKVV